MLKGGKFTSTKTVTETSKGNLLLEWSYFSHSSLFFKKLTVLDPHCTLRTTKLSCGGVALGNSANLSSLGGDLSEAGQ